MTFRFLRAALLRKAAVIKKQLSAEENPANKKDSEIILFCSVISDGWTITSLGTQSRSLLNFIEEKEYKGTKGRMLGSTFGKAIFNSSVKPKFIAALIATNFF